MTNLADSRNKPLPDGGASPSQTAAGKQGSGSAGDRFNAMGGNSLNAANVSTPTRGGVLPPSVVISPSAPVSVYPQ